MRPWGLGAALAIVTFVLIRNASFSPTRGRIIAAAIAAIASVQCLYQNAVLLAAMIAAAPSCSRCGANGAASRCRWASAPRPRCRLPYAPVIAAGRVERARRIGVPMSYLFTRLAGTANAAGMLVALCWLAALPAALGARRRGRRASTPRHSRPRTSAAAYAAWTIGGGGGGVLTFYWWFRYPTQPWY